MSNLFKPIDGSAVVLCNRGLYSQVEVSERGGQLYAKKSGGFIALLNSGLTSYGDVKWSDLDLPAGYKVTAAKHGRVTLDNA